ncbi:iron-containing alcohol dehydrogenase family protein [Sporolactobacillus inulinus]|uniref:iron-containing alcohol dehydrogenase family protein n=1 Tax=Sporolactobacillus inulinus TaxID=2078 RepID=UPI0011448FB9|nr:iron-containing alcohol dehydrogenase family protein [Sporolactobacillus inulinus]GEB76311.1 glycerol dehydrogenase [Sporolactobacillus inulinus]
MAYHVMTRIGPQQYVSEQGAYGYLIDFLKSCSATRVLFLHGTKSLKKALRYLPRVNELDIDVVDRTFSGECSYQEVDRVAQDAKEKHVDVIIGLGGGKVLDTAKAAAFQTGGVPFVLMPTMASNCAAWSALSVFYKEDGRCVGHRIFPNQSNLVLLEPRVILDSPYDYFVAGIADTLAKWYESESLLRQVEQNHLSIKYARASATMCRDVPLKHGVQAVRDMKKGILSDAWQLVMETNIMAGGLVGGLADQYGRATAAHSVHDALTVFPETVHLLHGAKVAYGIMVQLALERKWEEIRRLIPFYSALELPANLHALRLGRRSKQDICRLAEQAVTKDKTIHLLPFTVTADSVYEAIIRLEALTAETSQNE